MDTQSIVTLVGSLFGGTSLVAAVLAHHFRRREAQPAQTLSERQADAELAQRIRDELRADNERLRARFAEIEGAYEAEFKQRRDTMTALQREHADLAAHVENLLVREDEARAERQELARVIESARTENERLRADNALVMKQNSELLQDNLLLRRHNLELIGANAMLREQNESLRGEIDEINRLMREREPSTRGVER